MKTILYLWLSACMIFFNVISLNAQTIYTVDNNVGATSNFTDLPSAVAAATSGDIIYIQQSATSYGNVTLDKNLTLIGRSKFDNGYFSSLNNVTLDNRSSGSEIRGLNIINVSTTDDSSQLNETIDNITIEDCNISFAGIGSNNENFNTSGNLVPTYRTNNILLRGNTIGNCSIARYVTNFLISNNHFNNGLNIVEPFSITVSNNYFENNSTASMINNQSNGATLILSDNLFVGTSATLSISGNYRLQNCLIFNVNDPLTPVNIINSPAATITDVNNCIFGQDPLLTNYVTISPVPGQGIATYLDTSLLPGSPAIGAGFNGGNIGIEAGYEFKVLGNPKGYPEVKVLQNTTSTSQNGTLIFEIEARSN